MTIAESFPQGSGSNKLPVQLCLVPPDSVPPPMAGEQNSSPFDPARAVLSLALGGEPTGHNLTDAFYDAAPVDVRPDVKSSWLKAERGLERGPQPDQSGISSDIPGPTSPARPIFMSPKHSDAQRRRLAEIRRLLE